MNKLPIRAEKYPNINSFGLPENNSTSTIAFLIVLETL